MKVPSIAKQAYEIFTVPHPILKAKAKRVVFPLQEDSLSEIFYLKTSLKKNFQKFKLVGLSAPQVGVSKRFFVVASNLRSLQFNSQVTQSVLRKLDVFINPQMLEGSAGTQQSQQNCASVPFLESPLIQRHKTVKVKYFDAAGRQHQKELSGFRGMIFQHQLDHLNGITVDQRLLITDQI